MATATAATTAQIYYSLISASLALEFGFYSRRIVRLLSHFFSLFTYQQWAEETIGKKKATRLDAQ